MKQKLAHLILDSSRVCIRPHQDVDAPLLQRAIRDSAETLQVWMEWALTPQSLERTKDYIEFSQTCWSTEHPKELPFLIFDPQEEILIGAVSFNAINWEIPALEIGYWVNTHYSNLGFITESVNILTDYAFSTWGAKRIEIRCDAENRRSAAVASRLGFVLEAQLKNHRIQPLSKKLGSTCIFARYDVEGLPKIDYRVRNL